MTSYYSQCDVSPLTDACRFLCMSLMRVDEHKQVTEHQAVMTTITISPELSVTHLSCSRNQKMPLFRPIVLSLEFIVRKLPCAVHKTIRNIKPYNYYELVTALDSETNKCTDECIQSWLATMIPLLTHG